MKRGRKVVCGSQDGLLSIFDFNDISVRAQSGRERLGGGCVAHKGSRMCGRREKGGFGAAQLARADLQDFSGTHAQSDSAAPFCPRQDFSERFPGHPESVDALVSVTDDVAVSGSSDGLIRVLSVGPNRLLGVVGVHSDFPIERLALSTCKRWLASASHDQSVKLWDVQYLQEVGEEGEEAAAAGGRGGGAGGGGGAEEEDSDEEGGGRGKQKAAKKRKGGKKAAGEGGGGEKDGGKKGKKKGGGGSGGGFFSDLA